MATNSARKLAPITFADPFVALSTSISLDRADQANARDRYKCEPLTTARFCTDWWPTTLHPNIPEYPILLTGFHWLRFGWQPNRMMNGPGPRRSCPSNVGFIFTLVKSMISCTMMLDVGPLCAVRRCRKFTAENDLLLSIQLWQIVKVFNWFVLIGTRQRWRDGKNGTNKRMPAATAKFNYIRTH